MTNEEIIEQLENAIELIKQDGKDWLDDRDIPILEACIKSLIALDKIRTEIQRLREMFEELPPVTLEKKMCNQCKYYEGVHNVQGHAPCSFLKCGGVLWDWYCSNYEPYKELSPVTQESCDKGGQN